MRLAWSSDVHLNHVALPAWEDWVGEIRSAGADALLISGDLSEADDVVFQLRRIAETFDVPTYFVLGNHDFYFSSIGDTRRQVASVAREHSRLEYLTDVQPINLGNESYLIGDDGWADAIHGDFENSPVRLNDFPAIADFSESPRSTWQQTMRRLGRESADRLSDKLAMLSSSARQILVSTHVPPYREACLYDGKPANDDWAPFFICAQVGEVLHRFALDHPHIELTVLCGHTHHAGEVSVLANLKVLVAAAEYGKPRLERVLGVR